MKRSHLTNNFEPIEHYTVSGKYLLKPIPPSLEKVRGVHPRIFLSKEQVADLRTKIKTTHAHLWNKILEQADRLSKKGPPKYSGNDEGRYAEQWWQASNGPSMITLALAYLMTGEQGYLNSTREWALTTCNYRGWGVAGRTGSTA